MKAFKSRSVSKWLGFLLALGIVLATVWVSNNLVEQLKIEEQKKMDVIVQAMEIMASEETLSNSSEKILTDIIKNNTTIPMILEDEYGDFAFQRNLNSIEEKLTQDSVFFRAKVQSMASQHPPIEVNFPFGKQMIYYENSALLSKLRYYPIVLILILGLFGWFTVWYFRTLSNIQRSFLWAGMAKETAHQIGTPLSSLMGWLELLKMEDVSPEAVKEMENDVQRLNQIAERFSKIGSQPHLQKHDVVALVYKTHAYLSKRISSHVQFTVHSQKESWMIAFNPELLSWVLENLVRNAVDAMQNRGKIEIQVYPYKKKYVCISVKDNGPGISQGKRQRIFEPGYTTKKRGWGLGLSLAKRIVEEYHKGKIFVAYSEKGKGTEFKILLKK